VENCQEGFPDEEVLMERCEKKAVRHMCGKFESMNQLCDYTAQQRKNEMDGTYYFDEGMLPKTCSGDVRASLLEMCTEAEKIPGISVDHWPWQGHSLNLNKRGFSGDWMLGPHAWSGQNEKIV